MPGISGMDCWACKAQVATANVRLNVRYRIFMSSPNLFVSGPRPEGTSFRSADYALVEPQLAACALSLIGIERAVGIAWPVRIAHGGNDLVVLLVWQDANKGHHALHEPAPVGA